MQVKSKKMKAKGESSKKRTKTAERKVRPGIPITRTQNYTTDEIALWLRLPDNRYVLRAIRNGELKASKHGRRYIIYGADALIFNKKKRVYSDK